MRGSIHDGNCIDVLKSLPDHLYQWRAFITNIFRSWLECGVVLIDKTDPRTTVI